VVRYDGRKFAVQGFKSSFFEPNNMVIDVQRGPKVAAITSGTVWMYSTIHRRLFGAGYQLYYEGLGESFRHRAAIQPKFFNGKGLLPDLYRFRLE